MSLDHIIKLESEIVLMDEGEGIVDQSKHQYENCE